MTAAAGRRDAAPHARLGSRSPKILIVTGDGGESYEALYAVHRFREAGCEPVVAAR